MLTLTLCLSSAQGASAPLSQRPTPARDLFCVWRDPRQLSGKHPCDKWTAVKWECIPFFFAGTGVINVFVSVQWKSGVVRQLGWTVCDDLLCIQEDGTVLVYDLFGSFKRHFSMGNVRRSDKHAQHNIMICLRMISQLLVHLLSVFSVLFLH